MADGTATLLPLAILVFAILVVLAVAVVGLIRSGRVPGPAGEESAARPGARR